MARSVELPQRTLTSIPVSHANASRIGEIRYSLRPEYIVTSLPASFLQSPWTISAALSESSSRLLLPLEQLALKNARQIKDDSIILGLVFIRLSVSNGSQNL